MSTPRSDSRSSTWRSDKGYQTYIITVRRITSGELLKLQYWFLIQRRYGPTPLRSKQFALTLPFITSTSYCICPVSKVNDVTIGDGSVPRPVIKQLIDAYVDYAGCD